MATGAETTTGPPHRIRLTGRLTVTTCRTFPARSCTRAEWDQYLPNGGPIGPPVLTSRDNRELTLTGSSETPPGDP